MKKTLFLLALGLCVQVAHAQQPDDLTVTLPSGKVVTFQTAEQKSKFLAGLNRVKAAQATPAPAPEQPKPQAPGLGHTALDEKPQGNGKVNVTAPTFTAAYYMAAPETWAGKQVTLSVAYLTSVNEMGRKDGLRRLWASTWNTKPGVIDQIPGGGIMVLAKPEAATKLLQLCGSHYQYNGGYLKTTLIKGEFNLLSRIGAEERSEYGVLVEK